MIINSPSNKSQIRSFNMYTRTIISFDSFFFFLSFSVPQICYLCAPEYIWPWINCVLFLQRPFETLEKSVIRNVINFLFKLFSLSPFILSSAHIRMGVLTVLTHFHSVSTDVLTKTRMTTPIIPFRLTDGDQYIGRRGNVDIFTPIWQPQSLSRIYRRVSRNWNTKKSELCYIRLWLARVGGRGRKNKTRKRDALYSARSAPLTEPGLLLLLLLLVIPYSIPCGLSITWAATACLARPFQSPSV